MLVQSEDALNRHIVEFTDHLSNSLADGTFVRVLLSGSSKGEDHPERILGRCIDLRGEPHLSLTLRFKQRDEVRNLRIKGGVGWIAKRLRTEFRNALLGTTTGDWQLTLAEGKRPRLIRHPASTTVPPDRRHDQTRQAVLDPSASDWLEALGITDAKGKVRAGMADKYTQINRYLEVLAHLAKEMGWVGEGEADSTPAQPRTLVDLGCGKGYLTFGLWHLWRRVWKLPVQVIGVEVRADLVDDISHTAEKIQAEGLKFMRGTIESVPLPPANAIIALHACDTATDDAICRAIELGAQLIILAPCCHKEVRPQLKHPAALAGVLRHGIMEERMAEWLTDGLRALFLEWAGYRTKLFEFVSPEHTAKNLMIAAIRDSAPYANSEALSRIQELKSFFGIETHRLDPLLKKSPTPV